jgi:hypothetical protein
LILAAGLFSTLAFAEDPYQGEGDNSFGPYETNAAFTKSPVAGFRELHASAESLRSALKPAAAAAGQGVQILSIENTALSSVTVEVNGTKVGVLGPLTIGRITDVPAGSYEILLGHPNGFQQRFSVNTDSLNPAAEKPAVETPQESAETPESSPEE